MESFLCGTPEASQKFYERNKPVIEAATKTHDLCYEMMRLAHPKLKDQEKTILWLLVASCLREFEEIMLLAGNGFGTGAIKLMRAFYERTVTLSYLATEEGTKDIQRFVDYSAVHWHKLLVEAENVHAAFKISAGERKGIEETYESVKGSFREDVCPTCHKRPPMTWTKVNTVDMASKISEHLRLLCFNAYLAPTFHLHTTHWGIVNQSERSEDGKLRFSGDNVQEAAAQEAFDQAYILLMQVMDVLDQTFELGMTERLQEYGQERVKACEAVQ